MATNALTQCGNRFLSFFLLPPKEVNAILRTFHDDVASLRREMIDERIMMRENGRYWLLRPHS